LTIWIDFVKNNLIEKSQFDEKNSNTLTFSLAHTHLFNWVGFHKAFTTEQITWHKSNLLMKIILQNAQTLQPFKKIIKTESIYKSILKATLESLREEM
jgi:hypothetical protein